MTDAVAIINMCEACTGIGFNEEFGICLVCDGTGIINGDGHPFVVTDLRHANPVEMVSS